MSRRIALAAAGLALATAASAAAAPAVSDGWLRSTYPGQPAAAGYLTIVNPGPADRLVAVRSPRAARAGLHSTSMAGGIMRMRPLPALAVARGARVTLAPGGTHLMLSGLAAPLRAGERVPVVLRFERAGEVRAVLTVRPAAAAAEHHHGH